MASTKYTDQDIIAAVKDSKSYADVCRKLGISPGGGNSTTIKKKIIALNLDISHFTFRA